MPRKKGESIKYLRLQNPSLLRRLANECDLSGDTSATVTANRLLIEGLTRAEEERKQTGQAMAAAMYRGQT